MVPGSITGAVGKGAKNVPADVTTVQKLINAKLIPPLQKLSESGKCDQRTIDLIMQFQAGLGDAHPNGRVDPLGATFKALKDPHTKWKDRLKPGGPPSLGKGKLKYQTEMAEALKKQGASPSDTAMFLKIWEEQQFATLKPVLGMITKADEARQLAIFAYTLRKWGVDFGQITRVLVMAGSLRSPQFLRLMEFTLKHGSKLEKLGKGAEKVGVIITVIEVTNKINKNGDYSIVPAEIYKFVIGKGVPWAGALEGFQSLLDGLLPDTAKNTLMFKLLRAVDPAGLGAVGVDAVSTLVYSAFELCVSRKTSSEQFAPRLDRLVQRMRESPANFFVERGEAIGDALYDLSQMGAADYAAMAKWPLLEVKNWWNQPKAKGRK